MESHNARCPAYATRNHPSAPTVVVSNGFLLDPIIGYHRVLDLAYDRFFPKGGLSMVYDAHFCTLAADATRNVNRQGQIIHRDSKLSQVSIVSNSCATLYRNTAV